MHKSSHITYKTTLNIFKAFDYARAITEPLNYYVVIHLKDTPYKCSDSAFKEICQKYRVWLKYKSKQSESHYRPLYVFSHENPNHNTHVNWVLHIPDELISEFKKKLAVWVDKVQGLDKSSDIKITKVNMHAYKSLAKYILKGTDPDCTDRFFLRKWYNQKGSQGIIFGQRAGFSRALGPTARKRDGFNSKSYRTEIKLKNEASKSRDLMIKRFKKRPKIDTRHHIQTSAAKRLSESKAEGRQRL